MLVQPKLSFLFNAKTTSKTDAVILFASTISSSKDKTLSKEHLPDAPTKLTNAVLTYGKRVKFAVKENQLFSFDDTNGSRIVVAVLSKSVKMFDLLTLARKSLDLVIKSKAENVLILSHEKNTEASNLQIVDAVTSAATTMLYEFPKYTEKPDHKAKSIQLAFGFDKEAKKIATTANSVSESTNLVRYLGKRAGNDLDSKNYRTYFKEFAKEHKLKFEEFNFEALKKMGAGAFVAVAQGSAEMNSAIVKLQYSSKNKNAKHLCLVGKGIVFDTGGTNLKPANYMIGMNNDMAGSALALGILRHAVAENWDLNITLYAAITDNAIGSRAFRQNDVVKSLKGTTIEIIHTDAEGRMVLSDTLHMATKDKPDLMMDFATLTGACMYAIGTTYSGVFTNREELHSLLIESGKASGERVWPFPMDKDFMECLESDVADLKQCRLKGGVDHIEAAQFLKHFVGEDIPWVHMDLSSINHDGGLAHIPTEETGFGVRFATKFITSYFENKKEIEE